MSRELQTMEICRLGNPILRQEVRSLGMDEILSEDIQQLIADIKHTLKSKDYGVGLAAPQVGHSLALAVIGIKPTPNRPNLEQFEQVIINPSYEGIGDRVGMWEGCISVIEGRLFAQAMRHEKIKAKWLDENGKSISQTLGGFTAHVFQHETDHVNGKLFIDLVENKSTYMAVEEYRKRILNV